MKKSKLKLYNKYIKQGYSEEESLNLCECKECEYVWNPFNTEHFNFTCCELCGSDKITGTY